jgi:hypothetical protein
MYASYFLLSLPQEPTKIIATHCEVRLIQIKFYRPNWFMRRSFSLPDRMLSLALESFVDSDQCHRDLKLLSY